MNAPQAWPMRRMDRALSQEEALEVIERTDHAVLATVDDKGWPYCVPVTPVLLEGRLYFHSTNQKSHKASNMRVNPQVCLCFIGYAQTDQPAFSVDYADAVVQGLAAEVLDKEQKKRIMLALCERKAPAAGTQAARQYCEDAIDEISVWEVSPERITGKARNKSLFLGASK